MLYIRSDEPKQEKYSPRRRAYSEYRMKTPVKQVNKKRIMIILKGVFAKNERGYRLNAIKKRF